jgi:hypothetical protein
VDFVFEANSCRNACAVTATVNRRRQPRHQMGHVTIAPSSPECAYRGNTTRPGHENMLSAIGPVPSLHEGWQAKVPQIPRAKYLVTEAGFRLPRMTMRPANAGHRNRPNRNRNHKGYGRQAATKTNAGRTAGNVQWQMRGLPMLALLPNKRGWGGMSSRRMHCLHKPKRRASTGRQDRCNKAAMADDACSPIQRCPAPGHERARNVRNFDQHGILKACSKMT